MNNYELAYKDYLKGMKYKDIADKYGVTLNTVKSWKTRYWGAEKKRKVCTPKIKKGMHTKKVKEIAKEMIIAGASISEVANQTELNKSTIKRLSSEYNLQAKQLEYLKEFRDKQRERILKNKLDRLELNTHILQVIKEEVRLALSEGTIHKSVLEKLKMSEDLEKEILELERIERLEKQEKDDEKETEGKVMEYLSVLKEGLKDE